MQFNQPFYNTCMNDEHNTYPSPYPCANIVGEGDVTSLVSPNGSVQFYFVPLSRRDDRRAFYPYSPPFPGNPAQWSVSPEAWSIRRIFNPVTPSFIQNPYANKEPFLKSYFASQVNTEILPPSGYYQKFHYDNVTSTSDIHYFFPKLRQGNVKYSSGVQVDIPPKCHKSTQYETISSCPGPISNIQLARNIVRPYANATDSAMSIDEKNTQPRRRRKDTRVSFKHHNKHKKPHTERQACRCNSNNKSDKSITTYSDKACCCLDANGRNTQTTVETVSRSSSKSHLSDANTATSCESCCQTCEHCDDSSSDSDVDK